MVDAPCFLCASPSRYRELDGGGRRHYRCAAASCGEYVVTDAARHRLDKDSASSLRRQIGMLAGKVSDESKVLEIWVSPETNTLETRLIDRPDA